jgi:DNA-binding CsgD family transcriptional regulator
MVVGTIDSDTVTSVLDEGRERLIALGVVAGAYHLTPPFHSQIGKKAVLLHFGYAPDLIQKYLDPSVFEADPVPDYVMNVGHSMTWKQAIAAQALNPNQKTFVKEWSAHGLVDGIAIPLFGPNGRNSYSAFMLESAEQCADDALITQVMNLAQITHRKVCALVARDFRRTVKVSNRESEVIYWMARGKSNNDIGTILGIANGTVDTFVRRLFAKLEVHDRVSAVVEGMARGLVIL